MRNKAAEFGPGIHKWWKDWRGETAAVIASGPSAKAADVSLLKDKMRVGVVNDSYKLAPWADILYATDIAWWQHHKGAPQFEGLKLTFEPLALKHFPALQRIEIKDVARDALLIEQPGCIGSGGNGGFQLFNLLIQFGIVRIMLIGVDCHLHNGCHWHGRHPSPMNNPAESNVVRWRKAWNESSAIALGLGIEVINCSPDSAVTAYPKMTVGQALEKWGL